MEDQDAATVTDTREFAKTNCADISDHVGRWKAVVCSWHDPGGLQGDGKHSRLEWRHFRELRACRRSHNRKSINIRPVLGALSIFSVRVGSAGIPACSLATGKLKCI